MAIKVLRTRSETSLADDARSLEEARKLARLRHPGIVTVHDVGVQVGQAYIVSDYLEGEDLAHWQRFERMLRALEQYDLARPEVIPLWASLLSLPSPDRFPSLARSRFRQRKETFQAMLEWLQARAARRPILFVVEDLHWADASTLEFLDHFLAEGLHESILTLLTFRPEFKAPWAASAHQA